MKYTAQIGITFEIDESTTTVEGIEDMAMVIAEGLADSLVGEHNPEVSTAWVEELGEFVEDDPNNHN